MFLCWALVLAHCIAFTYAATGASGTATSNSTYVLHTTVYVTATSSQDGGNSSVATKSAGLGSYILEGLGNQSSEDSSSAQSSTADSSNATDSAATVSEPGSTSAYGPYTYRNGTAQGSGLSGSGTSVPSITSGITTLAPSVPADGIGLAYAKSCNAEWLIYSNITYWDIKTINVTNSSYTTDYTATVKTVCGSIASVDGDLTPVSSGLTYWNVLTDTVTYRGAEPSCSINAKDCASLRSYMTSASESYSLAALSIWTDVSLLDPPTAMITGNDIVGYTTVPLTVVPPATVPTLTINGTTFTEGQNSSYTMWATGTRSQVLYPNGYNYSYSQGPSPTNTAPYTALCQATRGPACGRCSIHGDHVELLYFPVTTPPAYSYCDPWAKLGLSRITCPWGTLIGSPEENTPFMKEGCEYPQFNFTSTRNNGSYVVSGGHTFYENRAYISIKNVYASNSCARVGGMHTDVLVELQSKSILSMNYAQYGYNGYGWSFNFAELNTPIPPAAYFNQPGCAFGDGCNDVLCQGDKINNQTYSGGFCGVIVSSAFRPLLAVPPQLRQLDSAWNECALGLEGLYDPPKALHTVTSAAGVSMPSSTAEPASTQAPSTATKTEQPWKYTSPTTTAGSPGSTSPAEPQTTDEVGQQISDGAHTAGDTSVATTAEHETSPDATSPAATAEPETTPESTAAEQTSAVDSDPGTSAAAADPNPSTPTEDATDSADQETTTQGAGGVIASILGGGTTTGATSQASGDSVSTQDVGDSATSSQSASPQESGQNDPFSAGGSNPGDTNGDGDSPATTTNALSVLSEAQASQNDPSPTGNDSPSAVGATSAGDSSPSEGSPSESNPADPSASGLSGETADPQDPSPAAQTVATFTAGSQTFTASGAIASSGVAVVGGTTLSAGGPAATIGGASISVGSNGVVADGTPVGSAQAIAPSIQSVQTFVAGGQTLTASRAQDASGALVIGGNTLSAGGPAATIGGASISVGSNGVVADSTPLGSTQAFAANTPSVQTFTAGEQTFTASRAQDASGALVVGGNTLSAGGAAAIINGISVSVDQSGVVADGTPIASQAAVITTALLQTTLSNGQTLAVDQVQADGSTYVVIGSSTLSPGQGALTTNGIVVNAQSSGVVLGGTDRVPYAAQIATLPTVGEATSLTVGNAIVTALQPAGSSGVFIVDGSTVSEGGSAVTINNTPISAASSGLVIAGKTTLAFAATGAASPSDSDAVVLTLGAQKITATEPSGSSGVFVVDGMTISQGGSAVTINNTPISAVATGLVLGGANTVGASAASSSNEEAVLTFGAQTLTAIEPTGSPGVYVIDGRTISQGGSAMTINNTPVSAASDGVIVGPSTTVVFSAGPTDDGSDNRSRTTSSVTAAGSRSSSSTSTTSGTARHVKPLWAITVAAGIFVLAFS